MQRNGERYEFLKWGSKALDNFKVVPPGTGICHQVNLEHIAQAVWTSTDASGATVAYPDTCVGTDSHTTMVNGLGVLGWGVGGIEAEAAMLGQPVSMLIPEVVGFKLTGTLAEGITATDLVLTVTQMLRAKGVVGRFVEFYGPGLSALSLADRATIANMAPEYGATCGFFPVDDATLTYMRLTGREESAIALVEAYAKAQGMWRLDDAPDPVFTDTLELDMTSVVPSLAGPKRPQDKVALTQVDDIFNGELESVYKHDGFKRAPVEGASHDIGDGDVVIAAITSCTNTSNPSVLVAAGLVARKAHAFGLKPKPWVKTSRCAPGSQVVTDYLVKSGPAGRSRRGRDSTLSAMAARRASGIAGRSPSRSRMRSTAMTSSRHRSFLETAISKGAVSPDVRANFLASPPLVVAYALKGTVTEDFVNTPLGQATDGSDVYLRDVWPSNAEVRDVMDANIDRSMFISRYAKVFDGGRQVAGHQCRGLRHLSVARRVHLCREPTLFRGDVDDACTCRRHHRGTTARDLCRFDHDRPYFACRFDQGGLAGGNLAAGAPGQPRRFQQLWRTARASRGDDARHLCQYPHQERDDPRRRRRHDVIQGRGHADL